MPISCHSNVANFSRVTAATLVNPGKNLQDSTTDDVLLLAAFHSHSPGVSTGSALCVYRMRDVRARAADNVRKCHGTPSMLVGTQFYRTGSSRARYCTFSQVCHTHSLRRSVG